MKDLKEVINDFRSSDCGCEIYLKSLNNAFEDDIVEDLADAYFCYSTAPAEDKAYLDIICREASYIYRLIKLPENMGYIFIAGEDIYTFNDITTFLILDDIVSDKYYKKLSQY